MALSPRTVHFLIAAVVGAAAGVGVLIVSGGPASLVISATVGAFFIGYLAQMIVVLPTLTAGYLKKNAAADDAPPWLIFAVTLSAVAASVGALFWVVNDKPQPPGWEMAIALVSVPLGWLTVHVMASVHYAHLFWQKASNGKGHRGGLEFPGTPEPSGWDFLYFSFVIGMTAQTSDVAISDTRIRRFNLIHAIVSFFFNTVLVAAAVNLAVSQS